MRQVGLIFPLRTSHNLLTSTDNHIGIIQEQEDNDGEDGMLWNEHGH